MTTLVLPELDTWPEWQCPGCREVFAAPEMPAELRCVTCLEKALALAQKKLDDERRASTPREVLLRAAGCPEEFAVKEFREAKLPGGQWPRDVRDGRCLIHLPVWPGGRYSSLVVAGDVGVGKTMLATELLHLFWRRGKSILWRRADELVQKSFSGDREILERAVLVDVLLLDDLGRGYSGKAWNIMDSLVAQRHQHHRPTIYTTNNPLADGPAALYEIAPALADRLVDGLFVRLVSAGGSLRGGA